MNCEANVILVTLYLCIGVIFSYYYYRAEMKGKNWYLSDMACIGIAFCFWPMILAMMGFDIIAKSDGIIIKRKK